MLVALKGWAVVDDFDAVGRGTCCGIDSVVGSVVAGDGQGCLTSPPASLYWGRSPDFEGRWRIVVSVAVGSGEAACQRKIVGGSSAVVEVERWAAEYHVRCLSRWGN